MSLPSSLAIAERNSLQKLVISEFWFFCNAEKRWTTCDFQGMMLSNIIWRATGFLVWCKELKQGNLLVKFTAQNIQLY